MIKLSLIEKLLGSGFYTGYIPFASGTFGTLAALIIYLIPGFENPYVIVPAIIIFFIYGIYVGNKFENVYGKDPSECTIDEFVGTWISYLLLPKTIGIIIITFFLWRASDIFKPYPARKLENLNGGIGIMIDDVVSGFYTLIIMHLVVYFFGKF
ncbi:MAG: phosphatidylglycerophosphatase A [Bacteroidetes bacterium]|nr:phosphatidylglycerophosphatase A [Bacteroidota bacterium]